MSVNNTILPAALLGVLFLTGCTTPAQDCDPTTGDASLVRKFNCNYSGTYEQRVQEKERILSGEQEANARFHDVYAAIEKEKMVVSQHRKNAEIEYGVLQDSLQSLLSDLRSKTTGQQQLQTRINAAEKRIKGLGSANPSSAMEKQLQLEQLRQEVSSLQSDLGLQ